MGTTVAIICAIFALGVLVGLVSGPNSERIYQAHIEGWLEGYSFASKKEAQPHA